MTANYLRRFMCSMTRIISLTFFSTQNSIADMNYTINDDRRFPVERGISFFDHFISFMRLQFADQISVSPFYFVSNPAHFISQILLF